MDLFKLMGSVFVKTDDAEKSLDQVSSKAEKTSKSIGQSTSKTANSTQSMSQKIASKCKSAGESFTKVGKKVMPASVAVGGLGAVAIKTTANFDKSMSNVSAISGATGKDLQALRDKAKEMGEKTKFSASESADAMSYMAMAGWKTKDMLDGISGVMDLATASGEDLATTSDILTDGLTAFGLSAKESGRMADVMASASSNANTNVSLLGESYKYCASTAGAMGYSLEDITESLGLMANAGVKGSQAGTTLKNAMINLAKPTNAMQSVMDKYGISITNTDGSMKSWNEIVDDLRTNLGGLSEAEQTSAVATLFGKEATAGMLSVINAGPKDVEKLNKAINNSEGTAKKMADTMNNNLSGQLTILKSNLEALAISFGEIMMPAVMTCVKGLQGFVQTLNKAPKPVKNIVIAIGLLIAIAGPLLIAIGKVLTSVSTIMTVGPKVITAFSGIGGVVGKLGGLLKGLWAVMLANPIILIVALIVGLVAGFVILWNKSEAFRNFWKGLWNGIKNIVSGAVKGVTGFFSGLHSKLTETGSKIKESVTGKFKEMKTKVTDTASNIKEKVGEKFGQMKDKIGTTTSKIKEGVGKHFNGVKKHITDSVEQSKKNVKKNLGDIKSAYEKNGGGIKGVVSASSTAIQKVYGTYYNAINTLTGGKLGEVVNKTKEKMTDMKSKVSDKLGDIKSAFSSKLGDAKSVVSSKMSDIASKFGEKMGTAKEKVKSAIDKIKGFFKFSWSLPHLKMPHPRISGKFSLNPPSVPKFDISWYAKAMGSPMLFTRPTVVPTQQGMKGFGDAGDEMVYGRTNFLNDIGEVVRGENVGIVGVLNKLYDLLYKYIPELSNTDVYIDGNTLVGSIAPQMNKELGILANKRGRGR